MKFEINLNSYKEYPLPFYIKEFDIKNINFKSLSKELDEFNKEIIWENMWTVEDAKRRLKTGWRILLYTPDSDIKGWYWLDDKNEPKNLYINKKFRNKGVGKEMHFAILNICKKIGMKKVECYIDDWNISSQKCIKNAGWREVPD